MRAVILEEFGKPLKVYDVAERAPVGQRVVVRLGASGVCHSDYSLCNGQYPVPVPVIVGHEGAGTVIETGPDVRRVKKGDRVIASFIPACGTCPSCGRGESYLCEIPPSQTAASRGSFASRELPPQSLLGTMAETMTVHEDFLVKVKTDLPDTILALMGCGVTTGLGAALWAAKVQPGSSVAIFGAGGLGIAALQGAKLAGAAEIIMVDTASAKKQAIFSFGATHYVDPADGDPVEQIKAITRGRGTDYALELVGNVEVMLQAYHAARRGGTVVFVGAVDRDAKIEFPANDLHSSAKTLVGVLNGNARVRDAYGKIIRLIENGRLDLESMISRRYPLEGINEAFAAMMAGQVVRSILVP